jgi:hypothetical protein
MSQHQSDVPFSDVHQELTRERRKLTYREIAVLFEQRAQLTPEEKLLLFAQVSADLGAFLLTPEASGRSLTRVWKVLRLELAARMRIASPIKKFPGTLFEHEKEEPPKT